MQKIITQKTIIRWTTLLGILLVMGAFLVVAPTRLFAQDGPPPEEPTAQLLSPADVPDPAYAPGIVLVGLRGDVAAAASWGEIEVLAVEPLDLRTGEASAAGSELLTGYKLTVPVGTEVAAVGTLAARPDVFFAELDMAVHIAQSEPDIATTETPFAIADTLYHEQWYLQRIGISRAWATALEESGNNLLTIRVAVIDTGADFNHPDLAGQLATGRNYVDATDTAMDDNGHGTHISGLVAGAVNGAGMVGSGPEVEIIPLKALNRNGTGFVSPIAQAIRDAADDNVDIINMSLEIASDQFALRSAVQYAVSQGVLVIAASGNHNQPVAYPAAYPSVLAVGASTYFDGRASYSNRGPELDLVVPGGDSSASMLSSWPSDLGVLCPAQLRQVNGGLYCNAYGTSMATGVASGVAALIMGLRPGLDADEVQEILLDTATPILGSPEEVGRGRLDAAKAVRLALLPDLEYVEADASVSVQEGISAFTINFPLSNPSLQPLMVEVTPTITTTWFALTGPRVAEVSYGAPMQVQLLFTPTAVTTGTFSTSLRITTTTEDGGKSVYLVGTELEVFPAMVGAARSFIPWTSAGPGVFNWAEPTFTARTNHTVADDDGNIIVNLPFTMTVGERIYSNLRIFADGFVVAPSAALPSNLDNECLANQLFPSFAVYGWWSDLSMGASTALSTFQPDADHFVIEYNNFASAGSSDPDDSVTFQIVLHRNGQIVLNYAQVPEDAPEDLTVGAIAGDGRFYNQITCHAEALPTGPIHLGEVPEARQTFLIHTEDLY